ncbi:MAG: AcrR family transcriptional regulator [Bradymonadia bacterium]|jgi:AcrR family transcriptional regulator
MNQSTDTPTARTALRMNDQERREHLLLYGRRYFAEFGFDAMSMQEIAKRAGVSKGLLYHHFGGRRGFYLATVEHVIDSLLEDMQVPDGLDPVTALRTMIERFVVFVENNADIYQALIRGGLGADSDVVAQLDRVRAHSIELITAGQAELLLTPLQRVQLVGWIAWVESSTSAWLDTDDIAADTFIGVVQSTLIRAVAHLFPEPRS